MRGNNLIQGLAIAGALTVVVTAGALAQTKPKASVATSPSGAFDKLSLGNQKVAAALYQAQSFGVAATVANGSTPAARPLTLEQIAAKRRSGQAWGPIFREMKALGLVHEKSLGQVVARYQQTSDAPSSVVASDNRGSKTSALEVGSTGFASDVTHGVGKGGK
ncbi:MAG: hypothetical protein ACRELZ_18890 [Candidatus Rokuibacteriota bacterium]